MTVQVDLVKQYIMKLNKIIAAPVGHFFDLIDTLNDAQEKLGDGYQNLFEGNGINLERTKASKLCQVGNNLILRNNKKKLPPCWTVIYEL